MDGMGNDRQCSTTTSLGRANAYGPTSAHAFLASCELLTALQVAHGDVDAICRGKGWVLEEEQ